MTAAELAAIRARAEAATSGPWSVDGTGGFVVRGTTDQFARPVVAGVGADAGPAVAVADAAFIAHAREDVPALIDRVEALEAALRQADAALLHVANFLPLFSGDEAKVHRAQIAHGEYTEARQAIRAVLGKAAQ